MHQVIWTTKVLQFFIEHGNLNETEEYIIRKRAKGVQRIMIKNELHVSMPTLDRYIKRIKIKYDAVQREYPDVLEVRKDSANETFADLHNK